MDGCILKSTVLDYFNVRVIQKDLVYVIGIPQKYADEGILRKHEFFGQFGSIRKVIINRRCDSKPIELTASAYITYSAAFEAAWCIQEVDESLLDGRILRCTYGTTKYCSFYLKNVPCQNMDCMYLHSCRSICDILTKDELINTKHKLHEFESKNRNVERLGKRKNFEFLDELIKFKSHNDFRPPKKIIFEPIDFTLRRY
ncbi:CCR4-NOT transcription complex subunit 4 [Pancytospora epiphaga]|nr:CCR4-NOT transcription complex subunit 4 [Pancytospora epiphaga]